MREIEAEWRKKRKEGGREGGREERTYLSRHPALHGIPTRLDLLLGQTQLFQARPARQPNLRLDDIDPRHLLRDCVLHLRACVYSGCEERGDEK